MPLSRVTSTIGGQLMVGNIQRNYVRLTTLQQQLATGKQLTRPSDGPAGTLDALDFRSQLRNAQQHERNAADAQARISVADSALATAQQYLNRVRDLTLQARNASSDVAARAAIATEVRGLRESLLQIANSSYGSEPLFAGTVDTPAAYDPTSGLYLGNDGPIAEVRRQVAPGMDVVVNATGPQAFGSDLDPGGNIFTRLETLATAIETNDQAGMALALDQVDGQRAAMSVVQATLGARAKRIEDVLARNAAVTLELHGLLANVEDIDVPKTIIEMRTQEMSYQAALSVTARVVQTSLLDFLR